MHPSFYSSFHFSRKMALNTDSEKQKTEFRIFPSLFMPKKHTDWQKATRRLRDRLKIMELCDRPSAQVTRLLFLQVNVGTRSPS